MNIIRVAKNSNYTVINNTALKDSRLSWKAKGIIAYMLSKPDDWKFYISELVKHSIDGERAFRTGFKELKNLGYVTRKPVRQGQRIVGWETIVHEVPQDNSLLGGFEHVENEDVQSEDVQSSRLLNTDNNQILNKQITNTKKDIEFIDTVQEIIEYLNLKASKNFKATTATTKRLINERITEGYTIEDFKRVIDNKVKQWIHDPNMNKYLQPNTLFNLNKFEGYLNENITSSTKVPIYKPVVLNFGTDEDFE